MSATVTLFSNLAVFQAFVFYRMFTRFTLLLCFISMAAANMAGGWTKQDVNSDDVKVNLTFYI